MKKVLMSLLAVISLIITFALTACSKEEGTYFPNTDGMKANLEKEGYAVTVIFDLGEKSGTYLSAVKGKEFIEFYWLDNSDDCGYFYALITNQHPDSEVAVKIQNDEKFGNIVYCGTANAVSATGINVVKVKV